MLASLALVAVLWSGDGAAATAPVSVPIEPIKPIEPLDNGLDQPIVAHPYLYTLLETALGIGAGTVWYLRHGSDERWGRAMQWTSWRRKLFTTDEITFDGDHFNTNSVGHPFDGTAYYQIARGNGLSPAGAFVSTVLASTFWEYFVEIPENPSLNDLIMTPTAGAVIGEATYRLGRYLAQSGSGVARCGGALLFAPVATLNEAPLCHRRPRLLPKARLGLAVGVGRAMFNGNTTRNELAIRLGADVVSQSDYERPGHGSVAVAPGQWTSLIGDARFGPGRIDGVLVSRRDGLGRPLRAPLPGRRRRHRRPRRYAGARLGHDDRPGQRLRLPAPRSAADVHDRSATVGLLGPMFELSCEATSTSGSRCRCSTRSRSSDRWPIARTTGCCWGRSSRSRWATAATTTARAWSQR